MPDRTPLLDFRDGYSELLKARLRGQRQRAAIIGVVFLLSLIGFVAFGMLGQLAGRSAFFAAIFPIAFGLGYCQSWAQSNSTKGLVELVANLQRQ
jgi:hypothetical protein